MSSSTRAKVAAQREAAAKTAARNRSRMITGVVVGVLAVAVAVGVAVQATRSGSSSEGGPPENLVDGAIAVGQAEAPVTVTLYEDFLCPACADAETRLGSTLEELAEEGAARLEYRMMAFLDGASDDRYSTRALNAAACVVDQAPGSFPAYKTALYDEQPAEGGPGLPDARLVELAAEAGAGDIEACVDDLAFEGWTRQSTERASQDGVNQTPTIFVDGEELAERTPEALRAAVEAAAS